MARLPPLVLDVLSVVSFLLGAALVALPALAIFARFSLITWLPSLALCEGKHRKPIEHAIQDTAQEGRPLVSSLYPCTLQPWTAVRFAFHTFRRFWCAIYIALQACCRVVVFLLNVVVWAAFCVITVLEHLVGAFTVAPEICVCISIVGAEWWAMMALVVLSTSRVVNRVVTRLLHATTRVTDKPLRGAAKAASSISCAIVRRLSTSSQALGRALVDTIKTSTCAIAEVANDVLGYGRAIILLVRLSMPCVRKAMSIMMDRRRSQARNGLSAFQQALTRTSTTCIHVSTVGVEVLNVKVVGLGKAGVSFVQRLKDRGIETSRGLVKWLQSRSEIAWNKTRGSDRSSAASANQRGVSAGPDLSSTSRNAYSTITKSLRLALVGIPAADAGRANRSSFVEVKLEDAGGPLVSVPLQPAERLQLVDSTSLPSILFNPLPDDSQPIRCSTSLISLDQRRDYVSDDGEIDMDSPVIGEGLTFDQAPDRWDVQFEPVRRSASFNTMEQLRDYASDDEDADSPFLALDLDLDGMFGQVASKQPKSATSRDSTAHLLSTLFTPFSLALSSLNSFVGLPHPGSSTTAPVIQPRRSTPAQRRKILREAFMALVDMVEGVLELEEELVLDSMGLPLRRVLDDDTLAELSRAIRCAIDVGEDGLLRKKKCRRSKTRTERAFLDLVTMVEELLDLDYEVRRVPPPPSPALLPARSLSTERPGHPALLPSASGECSSSMAAFPLSPSTSALVPSSGIGSDPGPSSRTSLAAVEPPMSDSGAASSCTAVDDVLSPVVTESKSWGKRRADPTLDSIHSETSHTVPPLPSSSLEDALDSRSPQAPNAEDSDKPGESSTSGVQREAAGDSQPLRAIKKWRGPKPHWVWKRERLQQRRAKRLTAAQTLTHHAGAEPAAASSSESHGACIREARG
ncbi:hypothetical protein C8Q76DRAFT_791169 [Earliella scabrosa]|nr:hypothetical protein C8Q76DRAFT_791169 [Earliella scabrosa]